MRRVVPPRNPSRSSSCVEREDFVLFVSITTPCRQRTPDGHQPLPSDVI